MKASCSLLRGLLRPRPSRLFCLCAGLLGGLAPAPSGGDTIDLLFLYTPAARLYFGGTAETILQIEDAVAVTNQIFEDSGISHWVNIAHLEEVPYTEASAVFHEYPDSVDRRHLGEANDGFLDEAYVLRDLHGADATFLLNGRNGGQGSIWGGSFALVGAGRLDDYVLPHELGHILGCNHAIGDSWDGTEPGLKQGERAFASYSHGFHLLTGGKRYCTIMAYEHPDYQYPTWGTKIPYFSSPNLKHLDLPIGHEDDADNVQTIEETGAIVAAYRSAHLPGPTPNGVQATDLLGPDVEVTWNSLGFGYLYRVYRSESENGDYEPVCFWQEATSLIDESAAALTQYYYRVRASKPGQYAPGNLSAADPGERDLHPPYNVQASDGTGELTVTVTWDEVVHAGAYRIFRSESEEGTKELIGPWQVDTQLVDIPPKIGEPYYYWVTSNLNLAGDGETDYSDYNVGFRKIRASTCTATEGTRSDGVEITWVPTFGVPYYQVSRGFSDPSTRRPVSEWETGTSFLDTTAEPGTIYTYSVRAAVDAAGFNRSLSGASDTGWRQIEVPANVQATDSISTESVEISWAPSLGSPYYRVYRSDSGGGAKIPISDWIQGTTISDQPVPGIEFRYYVRASRSPIGLDPTEYGTGDLGARTLEAPTGVVASEGAAPNRIDISWNPVAGASRYEVSRSSVFFGSKTVVSSWQAGTSFSDTVSPGAGYFYRVRASAHSFGALPSGYSNSDYGEAGSAPPTNVQASDGSPTTHVFVTWQRLGGVHHYRLLRSTTIDGTKTDLTGWVQQAYQHDDTTAAYAQLYHYWVQAADNSAGDNASALSASDRGFRTVPAPSGVDAADGVSLSTIPVSWHPVDGASHYMVYRTSSPGGSYLDLTAWQTDTFFIDPDGDPGHTYYYRIKAAADASGLGASNFSSAEGGFKMLPAPDPVTASRGTMTDHIRVSWPAIPNASHFMVFRGDTADGPMSPLNGWQPISYYRDYTPEQGRLYYYKVQGARSAAGFGPGAVSAVAEGWITPPVPGRPDVTDATFDDRIQVAWEPIADGLYYRVWRKDSPGGTMVVASGWQTAASYDDYAVAPGQTYYYAVQAANDDQGQGASALGQVNGGSTRLPPPSPVTATDGSDPDRVIIFWPRVTDAFYYRVFRALEPGGTTEPITGWDRQMIRFEDSTAQVGQTYQYSVRCARGMTGYGESADSVPDLGWRQPPAPENVDASDGLHLTHVRIAWDGVFPGAYYRVSRSETVSGAKTTLSGWIMGTQWDDATANTSQTYYYHVECSNASDGTGAGPAGEDTGWRAVPAPAPPGVGTPSHLDVGVSLLPTFDWDDCAGAIGYRLSIWSDSGPHGVPDDPLVIDPLKQLSESTWVLQEALLPNTRYYWQVYSQNSSGETPGPIWEFVTLGTTVDASVDIQVQNDMVILTWGAAGVVMIEYTESLSPPIQWDSHAGPIVGQTSWTGPLPASPGGFFRLVFSADP